MSLTRLEAMPLPTPLRRLKHKNKPNKIKPKKTKQNKTKHSPKWSWKTSRPAARCSHRVFYSPPELLASAPPPPLSIIARYNWVRMRQRQHSIHAHTHTFTLPLMAYDLCNKHPQNGTQGLIHLLLLTHTLRTMLWTCFNCSLTYHYFGQRKFHKQTMLRLYAMTVIMSSAQFAFSYLTFSMSYKFSRSQTA